MRSRWVRPRAGGTKCSTRSAASISPTRSLWSRAAKPSTAHNSAASSRFSGPAVPKRIERDTSTTSIAVSSRSSTKRFTNGAPMRAVTFQSMSRTSSPGT